MVLSEIIEVTSQKFNTATIQILSESGLPAYLAEGIVVGLLADIREKKAAELTHELSDQNVKLRSENEKLQKKNKELELLLEETKKSIENVSKHSENDNPVEPEGALSENGLPEQKDDQKREGD
jgi:hypothetical protein